MLDTSNECHFFIEITSMVRFNKMIEIFLRTLIINVLLVIIIKPPFSMKRGRHSGQLIFPIGIIQYNYSLYKRFYKNMNKCFAKIIKKYISSILRTIYKKAR